MKSSLAPVIASINKFVHLSAVLPMIIPFVINLWSQHIDSKALRFQNWNKEYDIVVVGAGAAGSILTNQLIQSTKYSVLLLEAGGNQNFVVETPALTHYLRRTSSLDWQFVTEPQDNACLGLDEQRSHWSAGKVVGGSSAIGDMIYVNGNPEDYARWERSGALGWGWHQVRREFPFWEKENYDKKMTKEDIEEEIQRRIEENLSVGTDFNKPLVTAFKQSIRQLGYSFRNYNTRCEIGFSQPLLTINKGKRYLSGKSYLESVMKSSQFDIVNHAIVDKILIENMTANGVQFTRFGITYTVKASNEVILTAGAINSPAILIKSGIGPKEQLMKLNISLVKDLPVGQSLQDQVSTEVSLRASKHTVTNVHKDMIMMQFVKYMLFSEGLLSTAPIEMIGFLNVNNASGSDTVPDVQITLKSYSMISDPGFKSTLGISDNFWKNMGKNHKGKDTLSIEVKLLHPKSRGTFKLDSIDQLTYRIDPNYYSESEDMKTMIKALEFVDKIIESKPIKALKIDKFGEPEECSEHRPKSSHFYECIARHITLSGHSPISTCRMGEPDGDESVVDPQLRVIGLNGVRVADASVMPSHTSGAPMAAVLMIGQKMANLLAEKEGLLLKEKFNRVSDLIDNGFQIAYKFVSKYYGL